MHGSGYLHMKRPDYLRQMQRRSAYWVLLNLLCKIYKTFQCVLRRICHSCASLILRLPSLNSYQGTGATLNSWKFACMQGGQGYAILYDQWYWSMY